MGGDDGSVWGSAAFLEGAGIGPVGRNAVQRAAVMQARITGLTGWGELCRAAGCLLTQLQLSGEADEGGRGFEGRL